MQSKEQMVLKFFAKKIRIRRHELGYSQEVLAERAGLHPNQISFIERGLRNCSLRTIVQLSVALNISPKEFFPD